ncbi:hypothetical protein RCC89_00620 [Cytophagaceae bacterium ABcell3]|nr:hypothetical protein RCC89_00620 [Cytophagaceae bacterium ABcell3]
MEFKEYLLKKKIDPERFNGAEPQRYKEWQALFAEVHPESFTAQKKFLINELRRKYMLTTDEKG